MFSRFYVYWFEKNLHYLFLNIPSGLKKFTLASSHKFNVSRIRTPNSAQSDTLKTQSNVKMVIFVSLHSFHSSNANYSGEAFRKPNYDAIFCIKQNPPRSQSHNCGHPPSPAIGSSPLPQHTQDHHHHDFSFCLPSRWVHSDLTRRPHRGLY